MFEYSCEFIFYVNREQRFGQYSIIERLGFNSENPDLWDMVDLEADFYFDHPEIDKLPEGQYWLYARGIAEFESDVDWESGIDEGHFLLGIDKLRITPIRVEQTTSDDVDNLGYENVV